VLLLVLLLLQLLLLLQAGDVRHGCAAQAGVPGDEEGGNICHAQGGETHEYSWTMTCGKAHTGSRPVTTVPQAVQA
jgi:hypothetical protein